MPKSMHCHFALAALAFLLSSAGGFVRAEHEGKVQILLLGDSTTEGSVPRRHVPKGPHLEDVIRELLAEEKDLPPTNVINLGLSGEFIRRLLDSGRYEKSASKLPGIDYVFIRYGLNDNAYRENLAENFPKDYHELIERLKADHPSATIIVTTVIPYGDEATSTKLNKLNEEVAKAEGVLLFDLYPRYAEELKRGPDMLNYRRFPLEKIPENRREFVKPFVVPGGKPTVEVLDNRLDAHFGHLPGWFGDRHPNLAGYHVIGDETSKFLIPLMRAKLPKVAQAAVERGLAVMQRGAKEYPSHQTCFACHHQTMALLSMRTARESGLKCDEDLFGEQRQFTRANFTERKERLSKGEHVGGRAATVSYGLWTLDIAGDKPDELSEAMTTYLLSVQQPDGRWKPQSIRPPLETSNVSCTVLSAAGIKRCQTESQKERAAEAITKAKAWLASASLDDQEDLNFALWGEKLLDGSQDRIADLRKRILSARHPDGGWSQLPTMKSDAYSTGQTLYILAETGLPTSHEVFRSGVAFLLATQEEGGSWHVVSRSKPIQPWFDNGDPHDKDQFISIAATGWATTALARSLRP